MAGQMEKKKAEMWDIPLDENSVVQMVVQKDVSMVLT